MRNLGYCLVCLLLLAALGGCGGSVKTAGDLDTVKPEATSAAPPQPTNFTPEQKYINELLTKNGYTNGSKPTVIVVRKLARKLTVYQGTTPLKSFPVVLGNDPRNDKLCQGDTCTPEGVYRIVAKYPHPKWDYFMLLNYPNTQNWLKFSRAKKAGRLPAEADIGGAVGIHGTEDPLKNRAGINWTKGCVSLDNKDLEEIVPLVTDKTLVVITKQ